MIAQTTILVVDDDPSLRKTLSDVLRLKGYGTVTAATGAEAVAAAAAAQQPISLALIDLRLPDMSGMEVMARIKASSPWTEVIILTGHASLDTAIAATKKGAFSYLPKPYRMDDLLLDIRHAVERQQAQAEISRLASYPRLNPNPLVELDASGQVTYANPAAERHFPDLHGLGPLHPMLAGLDRMFAALRQGDSRGAVRQACVGDATWEEHISYVSEADVIRIYALDVTARTQASRELARRDRQQTAMVELSALALVGTDVTALYERAATRAVATLDASCCLVLEAPPAGGTALLVRASAGCDAGLWDDACLAAGPDTLWGHTLASGEPTCLPDLASDSRFAGLRPLRHLGAASGIILAIGPRDRVLGALALFTAERREFGPDETSFLWSVAYMLAVAVLRKRANDEIRQLASTDSLTGVANRRAFVTILQRDIERARRRGPAPSLIMFDLDHFKRVNDLFGHAVGDDVLRASADLVKRCTRAADVVARWGGEEFMVLIAEGDVGIATGVAEKLRKAMAGHRFEKAGEVTASFGVATFGPGDDLASLLKRADDALYAAKANGRNRVEAAR